MASTEEGAGPRVVVAGFALAALSAAIFAGWFVVTRFGVTHALRVWDVIALRFGVGALLLLPALVVSRHTLTRRAWLEGLLLSMLWGTPFVLFLALGLAMTSTAQASAITPTMMPAFAGLIGWLLLRERAVLARVLGCLAIVAGVALLVVGDATAGGRLSLAGIGCLLLAALLWALYTVRFRYSGLSPIQAAAMVCLWSTVLFLPFYLALGLSRLGEVPVRDVAFQALYQGGLMSAVGVVTFTRAVALLGAGAAAAVIALLPAIATAMAIPTLGEIPSPLDGLAIAVIAVGVILAARQVRPAADA